MNLKRIWITWEDHRRSRVLSNVFNAKYIFTHSKLIPGLSHLLDTYNTLRILIIERPQILFVQNPSLVLAAVAGWLKKIFGYYLLVDRHTNFRIGKKNRTIRDLIYTFLSDNSLKNADVTIVTNEFLKNYLEQKGGKGFVLPDKIPEFKQDNYLKLEGKHNIVFICTFADDEPFLSVVEAASKLPDDVYIYITGNYMKNKHKLKQSIPKNVVFTGFLPEQDYIDLLFSADAVMDLTDLDWCLVCGGYEALSVEKPFITSDKRVLREFYDFGAVFSGHTPNEICCSINKIILESEEFYKEIKLLKKLKEQNWLIKFNKAKLFF